MSSCAIQLTGINKSFGPVHANKDIHLTVEAGTIHGIIGENGAGKSTLMSILYGFYQADSGDIQINGQSLQIKNSLDAIEAGIGMVHQHFMLVETLNALENIMLGAESAKLLKKATADAHAHLEEIRQQYGLEVDLDTPVGQLPVGVQQRVEILKALYRSAKILILDEPTGVLTPQEADKLFEILNTLRAQGVTILLITHKLREVMDITDNVSVMRQGEIVAHRATRDTSKEELAQLMVGRPVLLNVEKQPAQLGDLQLKVEGLCQQDRRGVARLKNVGFELRAGEILGVAGVSGNGQTELLEVLSGTLRGHAGDIQIRTPEGEWQTFTAGNYPDAQTLRHLSTAHVPEDRLGQGVIKDFSVQESSILGYQSESQFGERWKLLPKRIREYAQKLLGDFDVRPHDPQLRTANLSGGNQQKLILGRELSRAPKLLLVGQPTRGVDIGAIEMIYKDLIQARDAGAAILLVSVELDEIMALSDRIMVMFDGAVVGTVDAQDATPQKLGLMMANAA